MKPTQKRQSFTLVEFLVTIGIVAVLTTLLIPALGLVRRQAQATGCLSNLRTIGTAIVLYANDHDMTLPGPVYPSFGGWYGNPNPTSAFLSDHLWTYLGLPAPNSASGWVRFARQPFVCPGYYQRVGTNQPNGRNGGYTTQSSIFVDGVETRFTGPFGLISGSSVNTPLKLNAISPGDIQNRKYWAISDLDSARDASGNNLPGSTIITSPIHVTFRNQLFFDFHAERVPYP